MSLRISSDHVFRLWCEKHDTELVPSDDGGPYLVPVNVDGVEFDPRYDAQKTTGYWAMDLSDMWCPKEVTDTGPGGTQEGQAMDECVQEWSITALSAPVGAAQEAT